MWLQAFYTDTCFATTGSSVCLFIVTYALSTSILYRPGYKLHYPLLAIRVDPGSGLTPSWQRLAP